MAGRKSKRLNTEWRGILHQEVFSKKRMVMESRPYECLFCTDRFITVNAVATHSRRSHPGVIQRGLKKIVCMFQMLDLVVITPIL